MCKSMKNFDAFVLWSFFVLVLTSCGKEEDPTSGISISIVSQAKGAFSRAPIVDSTEDTDFQNFVVWGNYEGTVVFTNQLVTRSGEKWDYTPHQYWESS